MKISLRLHEGFGHIKLPIRDLPNTTILQYTIAENHETCLNYGLTHSPYLQKNLFGKQYNHEIDSPQI